MLSLAVTSATYQALLVRIRDVSDDVRLAVFHVLGKRLSIRDVPISDRAHLLDQGLQDRSERVRRACEAMVLTQWLPTCRGSPVALLKALDIEQFPAIGTAVSRVVLSHLSANPRLEDAVPHNALEILAANSAACDAESIFFWREQCLYYQMIDRDVDKVAALLPNLSDFCKLVVVACEAGSEMLFIAQQLLALGHVLDFQDEFGRRKLLDCLRTSGCWMVSCRVDRTNHPVVHCRSLSFAVVCCRSLSPCRKDASERRDRVGADCEHHGAHGVHPRRELGPRVHPARR